MSPSGHKPTVGLQPRQEAVPTEDLQPRTSIRYTRALALAVMRFSPLTAEEPKSAPSGGRLLLRPHTHQVQYVGWTLTRIIRGDPSRKKLAQWFSGSSRGCQKRQNQISNLLYSTLTKAPSCESRGESWALAPPFKREFWRQRGSSPKFRTGPRTATCPG